MAAAPATPGATGSRPGHHHRGRRRGDNTDAPPAGSRCSCGPPSDAVVPPGHGPRSSRRGKGRGRDGVIGDVAVPAPSGPEDLAAVPVGALGSWRSCRTGRPAAARCPAAAVRARRTGTGACSRGTSARMAMSERCTGATRAADLPADPKSGGVTCCCAAGIACCGIPGFTCCRGAGPASRDVLGFPSWGADAVPLTPGAGVSVMLSTSDRVGGPGVSGEPSPVRGVTGAAGRSGLLVVVRWIDGGALPGDSGAPRPGRRSDGADRRVPAPCSRPGLGDPDTVLDCSAAVFGWCEPVLGRPVARSGCRCTEAGGSALRSGASHSWAIGVPVSGSGPASAADPPAVRVVVAATTGSCRGGTGIAVPTRRRATRWTTGAARLTDGDGNGEAALG